MRFMRSTFIALLLVQGAFFLTGCGSDGGDGGRNRGAPRPGAPGPSGDYRNLSISTYEDGSELGIRIDPNSGIIEGNLSFQSDFDGQSYVVSFFGEEAIDYDPRAGARFTGFNVGANFEERFRIEIYSRYAPIDDGRDQFLDVEGEIFACRSIIDLWTGGGVNQNPICQRDPYRPECGYDDPYYGGGQSNYLGWGSPYLGRNFDCRDKVRIRFRSRLRHSRNFIYEPRWVGNLVQ